MAQHSAKSKRNGFLLFVFGCIIAVSGAAKLNESERIIRIRQMSEGVIHQKIRKTVHSLAVGAKGQAAKKETLLRVLLRLEKRKPSHPKYADLVRKDIQSKLRTSYARLVARAAKQLHIHQPQAGMAVLKPKLLKALSYKLLPKEQPKVPQKQTKRKAKKRALSRELVTAMASHLMGKKKPKQTKKNTPKAVRAVLGLLVDQAVKQLTPYVMWESLITVSMQKIRRVALQKAAVLRQNDWSAFEKEQTFAVSKKLVLSFLETLTHDTGKALKLKSKLYQVQPDETVISFAKLFQPILSKKEVMQRLKKMSDVFAQQLAVSFALPVARAVAAKLQLVFSPVTKKTKKQQSKKTAKKAAHQKAASRPTSQPTSMAVMLKKTHLPSVSSKRFVWPVVREQRVAFLKTTKRIGGWPDSLPIFLFGSVLAFLGLLWWRRAIAIEVKARLAEQKEDDSNPFTLLKGVQEPLKQLQEDISSLDEGAVCVRVDDILEGYILPFAEVRRGVIEQLGMTDGAEILVTVAFGERMLNRVWSAASDGHLPEARSVLPDAVHALAEAQTQAEVSLAKLVKKS